MTERRSRRARAYASTDRFLYSLNDLERLCGVPVRTLHRWITEDRLATVTHRGPATLLDIREVTELVELRERTGRLPKRPRLDRTR